MKIIDGLKKGYKLHEDECYTTAIILMVGMAISELPYHLNDIIFVVLVVYIIYFVLRSDEKEC